VVLDRYHTPDDADDELIETDIQFRADAPALGQAIDL
jgi:hypothetical protein